MEAAPRGVVGLEICWLLVCLAMGFFQAAPGVAALLVGADLAVEAAGEALVKAGEAVAGAAAVGIAKAANLPVMAKDSDGEVKLTAGVVVELLSVEAALQNLVGQNAHGDPQAPQAGTLAQLLSVEAALQNLVGVNEPGVPLVVNRAAGVHLEVLAGVDLLLTVVVGLMDNRAGAVAELDGVHLLVVEIGVLKVPLVLKAFTLKWMAKLFKPVTQFLSGTMLMVVQLVWTLEFKPKRTEQSLLLPTLRCLEHTTLAPFHETQRSLSSSFAVSLVSSFWL